MKISELISDLKRSLKKHGDVPVNTWDCYSDCEVPVEGVAESKWTYKKLRNGKIKRIAIAVSV